VPWCRLSPWKWVPGISPGVKAAGAYCWRPTTLVVPNVKKIRGLNLPGIPWATSAFCVMTFTFTSVSLRNIGNCQRTYNTILDCCDNLKYLLKSAGCEILGFRRSVGTVFDLLVCCTASVCWTFTLEDGTNTLYQRVSNNLPFEVSWLLLSCWSFGGLLVAIQSNNKYRITSRPPRIFSPSWTVAAVKQLNWCLGASSLCLSMIPISMQVNVVTSQYDVRQFVSFAWVRRPYLFFSL